jgi:hypothetical protein
MISSFYNYALDWKYNTEVARAMRPKARGLTCHGGPPGWLEESYPAGVILYVMNGPDTCLFLSVPVSLTRAAQLRAYGIYSCRNIVNVHSHPS